MKNLILRKATLKDQTDLIKIEQQVVEAERPYNGAIKPHNALYYDLDNLLNHESSYMLVAEFEGEIVGTGYAQIRDSKQSLKHAKHSYFGFMYVDSNYRGLGINKKIMKTLIEWSKTQGVYDFYLDVYDGNEAAIKAYEKVGFKKSLVEMKLHLDA